MPPNPVPDKVKAKQAAVKRDNCPRAVHYGSKPSPHIPGVPQIQANLCTSTSAGMVNPPLVASLHNNGSVQYIPSNMPGNIAVLPTHTTPSQTYQQTKPDLTIVPLLERIKQKRKAQNTSTTSGQGLAQYVNGQMKPSTPISYIIMRVGHF